MASRLREVSYLTMKTLKKYDIVLPSTYSQTFEKIATELEVDFDNVEVLLKEINQNNEQVDEIVRQTNDNLDILHKSTSHAQKAIEINDLESLKMISNELVHMKEQINYLKKELFSDPLTGAYNRKWFSDYYLKDDRFQNDGFIAFIDLDKFKKINDKYGHIIGDQVLKYLVKFFEKELTYSGIDLVRFAGDEFLILFNKSKSTILNAEKLIRDIQEKLSQQRLKSAKIKELHFTFSFGFTHFSKGNYSEDILNEVDELMYRDKQRDKNI
ncbi:MAG: GGDEF domain-containing protein [Halarcobacter sp.]